MFWNCPPEQFKTQSTRTEIKKYAVWKIVRILVDMALENRLTMQMAGNEILLG